MMMAFCDDPLPFAPARCDGHSPALTRGGAGPEKIIEFLWFGDCTALIEQDGKVEIVGEAITRAQSGSRTGQARGEG